MYRKRVTSLAIIVLLLATLVVVGPVQAEKKTPDVHFWLTILHNNDGESQVINAGEGLEDFGGAARFKAVVDNLKWTATRGNRRPGQFGAKRGVIMISSGDNFIAGPEFSASLENGVPFYDTIAMELIGYDAVSFGNHDFDFGPDVLADFIAGYTYPPPYIGANLDFSGEPRLQAFVEEVIFPTTIVEERDEFIGVIGLETPNLPFISSPRNVVVSDDLVNIVQGQVDMLEAQGINKIILAGHLQNIENDKELVAQIDGVDVVIAGGGDELLANPGDLLLPGDAGAVYGDYPQISTDMDGTEVPVVTTSGEYRYVGRLMVGFNKQGEVVAIDEGSGPVRVATGSCNGTVPCDDAVEPDPVMQALVVDPVEAYLAALGETVVGTSEVDLDGRRSPGVRTMETNEGNLIADSQRWQAEQLAAAFGVPIPDVAIQNGGGIRNNTVVPAGPITALDTFGMVPFPNFVSVVPDIPREQFKEILENAVSCTQSADFANPLCGSGRFAQVSGFSFTWTASGTAMVIDDAGNVVTPGTRVLDVALDDGTPIVTAGVVQVGDPITIAIVDFSAKGGDQYPFRGAPFTTIGVTYWQAVNNYIVDGLGGVISAADYPEGGEGRITELP